MANLTSIPLELLLAISSDLSTVDLGSLRRTCKTIEASLFDSFAKEFFSKRQFMFTAPSLQTLVDISKHPNLSKELRHVIIGLDQYGGNNRPASFFPSHAAHEIWAQGYLDQTALLDLGLARDFLSEAFRNLPNLDTVGIRDYSARGRRREGPDGRWSSYGSTTVYKETGKRLRVMSMYDDSDYSDQAFSHLLYALGVAAKKPPNLEIIFRHLPHGVQAAMLRLSNLTMPVVGEVLKGFRSVTLSPLLIYFPHNPTAMPDFGQYPLRTFLRCTNNITHLRINFERNPLINPGLSGYEQAEGFLDWLALPGTSSAGTDPDSMQISFNHSDVPPIGYPHLKRLDIGKCCIESDRLLRLMSKFVSSLEELSLWKVNLYGPNVSSSAKGNDWSSFLRRLSRMPDLKLNSLMAGDLTQRHQDQGNVAVVFRVPRKEGSEEDLTDLENEPEDEGTTEFERVHYTFRDPVFLERLANKVIVQWPPPPPESESDSEEDDDGAGDDDEMDVDGSEGSGEEGNDEE